MLTTINIYGNCIFKIYAFNGHAQPATDFGGQTSAQEKITLQEETVVACIQLGQVLRRIHMRLLAEGYNVPIGKQQEAEQKV